MNRFNQKRMPFMDSPFARSLRAGAMILSLASPLWAGEETKEASAQEQKMESKTFARISNVREVQETLKANGQDPGAVDGIMGEKTRAALKAFQDANGLRATGRVNKQTAEKLGLRNPRR
jgi:peptidoglycan hydrolase-like protein with peptidoglycan-binding domain